MAFSTLHVIHLPHRTERKKHLETQAIEQGFEIQIWPGVLDRILPCRGISKAHKQIVRYAQAAGLQSILIAEDDIRFLAPGALDYFLRSIPQDYDLFLGNIFDGHLTKENTVLDFSGMTLYSIHERFYSKFLTAKETNNIDREMKGLSGKYVVCDPMVCTQMGGYSDNTRKKVDSYDHRLEGRNLFPK